jgi:hypothetical protein
LCYVLEFSLKDDSFRYRCPPEFVNLRGMFPEFAGKLGDLQSLLALRFDCHVSLGVGNTDLCVVYSGLDPLNLTR